MASRLKLHEELKELLGSEYVYFQPPSSVQMHYDAIRYWLGAPNLKRANDRIYLNTTKYEGVVISYDPDCTIPEAILEHFPMCSFEKPYVADNLNHFPFTLYY